MTPKTAIRHTPSFLEPRFQLGQQVSFCHYQNNQFVQIVGTIVGMKYISSAHFIRCCQQFHKRDFGWRYYISTIEQCSLCELTEQSEEEWLYEQRQDDLSPVPFVARKVS